MLWAIFAFGASLIDATRSAYAKKATEKIDEYVAGWATFAYGIPILIIYMLFTGIPAITTPFYYAVLFSTLTNCFITVLYMSAIKNSDISLVMPLLSFMIVASAIVSFLILGETLSQKAIIGILFVFAGAYSLKAKAGNLLAPIKSLVKEKGPRHMLIASVLMGINAAVDKVGIQSSSPSFYLLVLSILVGLFLLPKIRNKFSTIKKNTTPLLLLGSMNAAVILLFYLGIAMKEVAYVVAIRSTTPLISICLGCSSCDNCI